MEISHHKVVVVDWIKVKISMDEIPSMHNPFQDPHNHKILLTDPLFLVVSYFLFLGVGVGIGKIFVGGLSWQTTEESLRWHFEQYGTTRK